MVKYMTLIPGLNTIDLIYNTLMVFNTRYLVIWYLVLVILYIYISLVHYHLTILSIYIYICITSIISLIPYII